MKFILYYRELPTPSLFRPWGYNSSNDDPADVSYCPRFEIIEANDVRLALAHVREIMETLGVEKGVLAPLR